MGALQNVNSDSGRRECKFWNYWNAKKGWLN